MKRPLLSICIPTRNRGSVLKEILDKYASNPEFDDSVELVICDNCSTDDTSEVVRAFADGRSNVVFHRNDENINDLNFPAVLDMANGEYLKLTNDWCYFTESSLRFVKDCISAHISDRTPLFFTNGWLFTPGKKEVMECGNLDEYVRRASTFVTSIGIFGTWREDWQDIQNKTKYAELKLMQVDWTYQIVSRKGCCLIDKPIYDQSYNMEEVVRRGYNWFQVHMDNYYSIMEPYCEQGLVSSATLRNDKRLLLRHFEKELCQIYIKHSCERWQYDTEGTMGILFRHCKTDPYFYWFMLRLPFRWAMHGSIRNFKC